MKSLLFFALLFFGASFGLQAQDVAVNKQQKAACKKVCAKKAEGQSVSMFTSVIEEAGQQKSCTAKMAKKANCNPANCNPANCKPANCKPANCKPASCKPGKTASKVVMAATLEQEE